MLTLPTVVSTGVAPAERPAYRPFTVRVTRIRQLSPHFRRVTFAGPDLRAWGTGGLDQRIKILFPFEGGRFGDLGLSDAGSDAAAGPGAACLTDARPTWHEQWRALAPEDRNPFRTYTVRAARPGRAEVDVDFVDHAGSGPAARWLAAAGSGDPVVLIGPDGRSAQQAGIDWRPGDATHALLVGDETAVPAVCAILESLPAGSAATVLLEVPTADDVLPVPVGHGVGLTWLPRGSAPVGSRLGPAVRGWLAAHPEHWHPARATAAQVLPAIDVDHETLWEGADRSTDRGFYAWLAGESAMIRSLRRSLVADHGVDRRQVAFMGYWRLGRPERQQ